MGEAVLQESKTQSTEIFTKYSNHLRNRGLYSAENGKTLLQLLFPEEDIRRKFGMQETRLSSLLAKVLVEIGFSERKASSITRWAGDSATETRVGRAGCLGSEVQIVMQSSHKVRAGLIQRHDPDLLLCIGNKLQAVHS